MTDIPLTSKPSREEVQKASEMLLFKVNMTDDEWNWACQIIKASREES